MVRGLQIDHNQINEFCRRWQIKEFSLFGSILRDDFRPDSDVDVLIEFLPEAQWSLLDWVQMIEELKAVFGREVDLTSKAGLRNPFRRQSILSSREVVYAA
jgi:predicted nucleotidyltransferase